VRAFSNLVVVKNTGYKKLISCVIANGDKQVLVSPTQAANFLPLDFSDLYRPHFYRLR
jgi:hypothetical protein